MKRQIEKVLHSALLRTLAVEPELPIADAVKRVAQLLSQSELLNQDKKVAEQALDHYSQSLRRCGVLNPVWLGESAGHRFHFYLVNAQPGWLMNLVDQTKSLGGAVSQYVLYGIWDSLVVLCGSDEEARVLRETMQSSTVYSLSFFSALSVPLYYRYSPLSPRSAGPAGNGEKDQMNRLVENWDEADLQPARAILEEKGVFLGPAWRAEVTPRSQISAYIGIKIYGWSQGLDARFVLSRLLTNEVLQSSMIHFFEVDRSEPFHYFAKVVCRDLEELDEATNVIGTTRVDHVRLEGNTFIVASGRSVLPKVRRGERLAVKRPIDLDAVDQLAQKTIGKLDPESISTFNQLQPEVKLILLRSLAELDSQTLDRQWSDEDDRIIRFAIDEFPVAVLKGPDGQFMIQPVSGITTHVEKIAKHVLRRAIEAAFGRNYARAQKELNLSHSDLRRVTLGQSVHAFKAMRKVPEFGFLLEALEVEWLERFDDFVEERNKWQHGGVNTTLSGLAVIDKGRQILVEGCELIRWFTGKVLRAIPTPAQEGLKLPEKREGREFGVFLSYSSSDKKIADRIAIGLRALGNPVWYDEWAIAGGDSILEKIDQGLARNDTLLLLLSPRSIRSAWVQKELNRAVMAQLKGQDVLIVPLLIDETEIPDALADIKYIDMRHDFEKGFIDLVKALSQRRKRLTGLES
jgi:TIR domain